MIPKPAAADRPPTHPGELLREEVLPALGISVTAAARYLGVSRQAVHRLLAEQTGMTAEMALRVGKLCGNGPEVWLTMQRRLDLWAAERALADDVTRIPTLRDA